MPMVESRLPEPWRRRLYLPAYAVSSAARYAGVPTGTVSYWHYSSSRLGPTLPGKERRVPLSYLQLIEVAFVATFRKLGWSLQRIHKVRDYARQTFEAEYPFVQLRWYTEGHHLLLWLKDVEPSAKLDAIVIADKAGQTAWSQMLGDRFTEFEYEEGMAIKWHVAGRTSSVLIDPRISFGAPVIKGVPTWALRGRKIAGESDDDIASDFGLAITDVREALRFEGIPIAA